MMHKNRRLQAILLVTFYSAICTWKPLACISLRILYSLPTSSEGRLPNIVDAEKKRQ
jgi:hypothetical protein